jgi:hypothetical protein
MNDDAKGAEPPAPEPQFKLTGPWILVGVLAVLLGIGCGLFMSLATFFR